MFIYKLKCASQRVDGYEMNKITLSSNLLSEVTVVSNVFIDTYMPSADGSYVKVYLHLLRCINCNEHDITISTIADRLDNSEKDIIRALKYWEKTNLIALTINSQSEITSIRINELQSSASTLTTNKDSISHEYNDKEYRGNDNTNTEYSTTTEQNFSAPTSNTRIQPNYDNAIESTKVLDKPTYSQSQIDSLTESDEIKWLMNIIEIYLERLLKPMDIQLILYLYESLDFSSELIMYLYEYCVSKNKKSPSYIEAVALSWAQEGIDSVEKAEATTVMYNSNYNAVNKAFGLNRTPGTVEKQFINKWLSKYGFDIEIIVEACNRTILMAQKPDFKYADKILENWTKSGVKHLGDITRLDEEHSKKNVKSQPRSSQPKATTNKFNSFPQRSYTNEDYSSLEQRLLNKN